MGEAIGTSPVEAATLEQLDDPSVASLAADHEIDPDQALQQMKVQVAAGRAERDLPSELRSVYAGKKIDHMRGGLVTVAVTDLSRADSVREHFIGAGVHQVEIQIAGATQPQMEQRIDEVQPLLRRDRPPPANPVVALSMSEVGTITVRVVRGVALNPTETEVVAAAHASPEVYTIVDVESIQVAQSEACDWTDDIECDPPLRGSTRTYTTHICTVGFNVRSRTDDKPYVLTAGHCDIAGAAKWRTRFEDGSDHVIGSFHNSEKSTATDVGIIAVDNPSGWSFGWPLVTIDPTGGYVSNENYVIDDVLNPGLGDRVCFTGGNTARTDCGTVDDMYDTGDGTDGLVKVDGLCTDGGDSGSPYWSLHVAYAVHSAGVPGCTGWGEQAPEAEDQMHVNIITS